MASLHDITMRAPQADNQERRGGKRKSLLTHADIELSDSEVLSGHAVDISIGGAGLISPVNLKVGQEIAIGMSLMACGINQRISLSGRVCYCVKVGIDRFRVGLQWIHLDNNTEAFINAVCA
jgi:c-di-GMP-binding flagellar brake protein YcgR